MHTFKPGDEIYVISDPSIIEYLGFSKGKISHVNENFVFVNDRQLHISQVGKISDLTPKSEVFKVRVVSVSSPDVWYTYLVGATEIFTVKEKDEFNYKIIGGGRHGLLLLKSDCEIVTDQKFKLNQPVLYKGMKAKVSEISVRNNQATEVVVEGENGRHKYYTCCEHDLLEDKPDQPTSLPFTEELFNEGKYDVWIYDDTLVEDMHKHNGKWYSDLGLMDISRLTLKEKEVVEYFVKGHTYKFNNLQDAMRFCSTGEKVLMKWNETTRRVEKVWDFLTDKK